MTKTKTTPKGKRSQADPKNFTKQVFGWLRQIKNDHKLPPSGALFALQLTEHFNRKHGGVAWASCKYIANAIGMSEATVINLFHVFERRGHLKVEWGKPGRGHSNRYWMFLKPQQAGVSEVRKPQRKPQPATRKPQPADVNLLNNQLTVQARQACTEGERVASRSPPDARSPDGARIEEKPTPEPENFPRGTVVALRPAAFAELLAVWERPWPDDEAEARRAFVAASRETEAEEIVDAARAWVAAADAPRFLPPLAKWLSNCGFKKVPPQRRQRARGNIGDRIRAIGRRPPQAVIYW